MPGVEHLQQLPSTSQTYTVFIPEDPSDVTIQRVLPYAYETSLGSQSALHNNESAPLHMAIQIGSSSNKLLKNQRPPLSHQAMTSIDGVHLRYMIKSDRKAVKDLCRRLFPLEYPDYWYDEITNNEMLFAIAAVVTIPCVNQMQSTSSELIIGLLVAETKCLGEANKEDEDILDRRKFNSSTLISYILSLGVLRNYRNKGIASRMLDEYLHTAVLSPPRLIKAVYLHVLHTNLPALNFYERREFRKHSKLRDYYRIDGHLDDAYTCVLYTNGGTLRWTLSHGLTDLLVFLCQPLRRALRCCLLGVRHTVSLPLAR